MTHTGASAGLRRAPVFVAVVALAAAWIVVVSGSASAHSLVSYITLTVSGSSSGVVVRAEVRYPDHDPVLGETVVGVAYSRATTSTVPLSLSPVESSPGMWESSTRLPSGSWQVEVDAITKTRGLQSVGFAVAPTGEVSGVVSPSALPATVQIPGTAAAVDGGVRTGAANSNPPWAILLAAAAVAVAVCLPPLLLRRRHSRALAGTSDLP